MNRRATKHAFKLAAVVIPLARELLDCLDTSERQEARRASRARRQAGRLMVAVRAGNPADALRRYERDLSTWAEHFT